MNLSSQCSYLGRTVEIIVKALINIIIKNFVKNFLNNDTNDIIILADNVCESTFNMIKSYVPEKNIVQCKKGSGAQTFNVVLDMALKLNDDEIVYFVENDYVHKPNSKKVLEEGFEVGANFVAQAIALATFGSELPQQLQNLIGHEIRQFLEFLEKSINRRSINKLLSAFNTCINRRNCR